MNKGTILFSQEDLTLFCQASGDRNPLHLEKKYASQTAYGQQVVYGVLGAVACFGYLELPPGQKISRVTADFHRPMFLNVHYRVEKSGSASSQTIRLFDGTVLVLTLVITHAQPGGHQHSSGSQAGLFERSNPRELSWNDLQTGLEFRGRYAADSSKLQELCRWWNVRAGSFVVEMLLWSSYFVGMELPGRNALFFRLALDLSQNAASEDPLNYVGVVSSLNKAVEQAKVKFTVSSEGSQLASGVLTAFVRPELRAFDFEGEFRQNAPADLLTGKVAVIIGASRGLGAALTASIALQGAHVVALSRSPIQLHAALPAHVRQRIVLQAGDSADLESLSALQGMIAERFGRLDFLICNAFPPVPALRLEANALGRIQAYMKQSMDLVLVPLCSFLPLLNQSEGCAVIISSTAVEKPVREWPHYIAAKSAIESFGSVAPLQYPNVRTLIVRPERLLTEMTNTPMGRQNALPPLLVARQITSKLQSPPLPGTVEILHGSGEDFPSN
ncbi:MAG: SDR family NAD(P)-dependent oxidoreductase [Acidobacteriaceae bacterium]|nr:SDR family NAD(P)-dependent oxidoreductase [Acidobacteriaceae bacterium]